MGAVMAPVSARANRLRVAMVALGEIGQCPRMQLHARALAEHGAFVDVVAYTGRITPQWLRSHPHMRLWPLAPPGWSKRHEASRILFTAYSLGRVVRIAWSLLWRLTMRMPRPDVVLLQTPPSIPVMPLGLLAARLRGATTIIDWHNYGYTILGLHLGSRHWAVRLMSRAERLFGRLAARDLCVSKTMARDLATRWRIADPIVLYDRPAEQFHEPTEAERDRAWDALAALVPEDMMRASTKSDQDRPAVLVSPTSWTADEDLPLLLDALEHCDAEIAREETAENQRVFPDILVLITGNGPMRNLHEQRIASLALHRIVIRTAWLSDKDFPAVLGSCDLGICLHTSSSGMDLPMKIAEMRGVNLPVCAYDYGPCLAEMVEAGTTAMLFRDSAALSRQIRALLRGFPSGASRLAAMREALRALPRRSWAAEWDDVAAPLFGLGQRQENESSGEPSKA
jgi:beta-1,4-mannosyltransferase